MQSAILPAYMSIGIHGNHMGMTKFETKDDPGFISVAGELRRWVKELERAPRGGGGGNVVAPEASRVAGEGNRNRDAFSHGVSGREC